MMRMKQKWDSDEYNEFRGRVAGLERALWEWSRTRLRARFMHPSLGHETAAFCVTQIFSPYQTFWAFYYRSHAWLLALGVPLSEIVAEIVGAPIGRLHGRGGSMHLLLHPNVIDCNSIVGAQIPIAVGAAMANDARGLPTICVLGDGATNTGVFYEALNIASIYRAPILFVVEDNQVAMDCSYDHTSSTTIEAKFQLFSIPFFSTFACHGKSVLDAVKEASKLVTRGPVAVCVSGERIGAHVMSSQNTWADIAEAYTTSDIVSKSLELSYYESLKILQTFH